MIKIDQGYSGISTCREIAWELDRKIIIDRGLVLVALTSGIDWGITTIKIDTTIE